MPMLSSTSLLDPLVNRDANILLTNTTAHAVQVICAWPVSGQYGPGSRVLYYVLVVACVLARKTDWLRNACLAAALLFPAVAALHGIVLAALHVDGAVDMDVFGAFQLCSIGILAAPVTVRLSKTYFENDGRNIIFFWTGLVLAGLLSLVVEFYRSNTSSCTYDEYNNTISSDPSKFPYQNASCGLICVPGEGPQSPMRQGSANNIYVIPAPDKFTFGTATLFAAACCIPAILSMVWMWIKVLEVDWKERTGAIFGRDGEDEDARIDEPIEGTNGATLREMRKVNNRVKLYLSAALEIPVFGAAILAILIIGERNLFSVQVRYQTEPIASIGQWAPIVGTGLAALGSLYLWLAQAMRVEDELPEEDDTDRSSTHHCNCSNHHPSGEGRPMLLIETSVNPSPSNGDAQSLQGEIVESPVQEMSMQEVDLDLSNTNSRTLSEVVSNRPRRSSTLDEGRRDEGNRRKVAKILTKIGNQLGAAAHDQFDNADFRSGEVLNFPEIPGEEHRNPALSVIRERYNERNDIPTQPPPSRAGSFVGSITSGEGSSTRMALSSRSTFPTASPVRRSYSNTLPGQRPSLEPQSPHSVSSPGQIGDEPRPRPRPRRDTLEVPSPAHFGITRTEPFDS